jgi:myosin heavy subunit
MHAHTLQVLVSINPFKQLPIYGPAQIAEYARPSAYRLDPPHTFAIANSAFRRLCAEGLSQAVLISGESGAGKTEATKQVTFLIIQICRIRYIYTSIVDL